MTCLLGYGDRLAITRCIEASPPWQYHALTSARVAELADAQDLGSCGVTRPGSTPGSRNGRR